MGSKMPDKKLTDNEIIKAFRECCVKMNGNFCDECPYNNGGMCNDIQMATDILDYINRQKAEIEALIAGQETLQKYIAEKNAEIERLCSVVDKTDAAYFQKVSEVDRAKAEAIKEFADRLKQYLLLTQKGQMSVISFENIDYLVKEMVGDAE